MGGSIGFADESAATMERVNERGPDGASSVKFVADSISLIFPPGGSDLVIRAPKHMSNNKSVSNGACFNWSKISRGPK